MTWEKWFRKLESLRKEQKFLRALHHELRPRLYFKNAAGEWVERGIY